MDKQEVIPLQEKDIIKPEKQTSFFCNICICDDLNFHEEGYQLSCGHIFCKECLLNDFKYRITNKLFILIENELCPQERCQKAVVFKDFENILQNNTNLLAQLEQKNIYSMYTKASQKNSEANEILVTCPGMYIQEEGKDEIQIIDQEIITKLRKEQVQLELKPNQKRMMCNRVFICERVGNRCRHKCEQCKYDFCVFGCFGNHLNYSCAQFEGFNNLLQNIEIRSNLEQQGYRFCPNCEVLTFKVAGSNRITCTNCIKSYCFICYFQSNFTPEIYNHLRDAHGGYW